MADEQIDWYDIAEKTRDIILDMMCGLRCYGCETVREFWLLRDHNHRPGPGIRFSFCESDHPALREKLDILVAAGLVVPVASDDAPLYRMTDEFVARLLDGWPERRWPDWWLALDWRR